MYRKIEKKLLNWKQAEEKKPIIITGARQVGKTYSCRSFAKDNYRQVLEINFQDNVNARNFFSESRSINDIMTYLEINNTHITFDNNTLIFFDEIQLVPELITSLKFFKEKCKCDCLCTGSMLGITVNKVSSFPVGYVDILKMYPMSFDEFVIAAGVKTSFIDEAYTAIVEKREVPAPIHDRFNNLFAQYMVCGGMPEAVNAFITIGLAEAVRINRSLLRDYEMDIAHYADPKTKIKALECFKSLPLQLAKDNKKFQYKLVKEGYNARYYDESLMWLENAGIIHKVYRVKTIGKPLEIYKEPAIFKAYYFDIGMLAANFDDNIVNDILFDALGVYKGVFFENIAAQSLIKNNINCYYYEPNSSSEIDFVISLGGEIIPIEIKGGLHTRSTSFNNFIKNHKCKNAFRFSKKNTGISDDGITKYLPVYSIEWVFSGKRT